MQDFNKQKIIWKRIGYILRFSFDDKGCIGLDSTCFATGADIEYLCRVLNSKMGHYLLKDAPKTGRGNLLVNVQAVDPIMIHIPNDSISRMLSEKLNILRVCELASVDNEIDDIIFHYTIYLMKK